MLDKMRGEVNRAGLTDPVFGMLHSPIIVAAAVSFSSVVVIGNALRLRRARMMPANSLPCSDVMVRIRAGVTQAVLCSTVGAMLALSGMHLIR